MTASPQGCGVLAHAPECLCDVVISSPVEIKPDLSIDDYRYGWHVLAHLGVPAEMSDEQLLDTLDHLARVRDALTELDAESLLEAPVQPERAKFGGAVGAAEPTRVTRGARMFINKYADSAVSNTELRTETKRIFGVDVSSNYMFKLRKRAVSL